MFRRLLISGSTLMTLLAVLACCGPADAGTDIDFGAAVRIGDDADLFLAVSSRYFDRDPGVVGQWRARYRNPDDVAVALFLAGHTGRDLDDIFRLRSGGLSWWDVGLRLDVRPDIWFVPCRHRPGPPYGRAYGFWRKHARDPQYRFSLRDTEVRDLVAMRMLHEYYGVDPAGAMQLRASHRSVESLMSREYRKRHADDGGRGASARPGHGRQKDGRDKDRPDRSRAHKGNR